MPDETNNCSSCADNPAPHPMGEPLANNPNVLVSPYTPPTAAELELTRNYYAAKEARANTETGARSSSQSERTAGEALLHRGSEGMYAQEPLTHGLAPVVQPATRFAEWPQHTGRYYDGMKLPDTSGLMLDPEGPAAISMRLASQAPHPESALNTDAIQRAMSSEDVLLASQLAEPWFEPGRAGLGAGYGILVSATGGWSFKKPPHDTEDKGADDDAVEYEGKTKAGRDVIKGIRLLGVPKVGTNGRQNHFRGPPPAEADLPCLPKGSGKCDPEDIRQFEFPLYDWFQVVLAADWSNAQQSVRWTGVVGTIKEIWLVETAEVTLKYRVCTCKVQKCCCGDDCFVYHWDWTCTDKDIKRSITREKKIDESNETWEALKKKIIDFLTGLAEGGGKAAGEAIGSATFKALGLK